MPGYRRFIIAFPLMSMLLMGAYLLLLVYGVSVPPTYTIVISSVAIALNLLVAGIAAFLARKDRTAFPPLRAWVVIGVFFCIVLLLLMEVLLLQTRDALFEYGTLYPYGNAVYRAVYAHGFLAVTPASVEEYRADIDQSTNCLIIRLVILAIATGLVPWILPGVITKPRDSSPPGWRQFTLTGAAVCLVGVAYAALIIAHNVLFISMEPLSWADIALYGGMGLVLLVCMVCCLIGARKAPDSSRQTERTSPTPPEGVDSP